MLEAVLGFGGLDEVADVGVDGFHEEVADSVEALLPDVESGGGGAAHEAPVGAVDGVGDDSGEGLVGELGFDG